MEEELKKLPKYTPYYIIDELKVYLERKDGSEFSFWIFENVISLVNFAKSTKNITPEQAEELKRILNEIK